MTKQSLPSDWRATALVVVGAAALLLAFILSSKLGRDSNAGSQDDHRPSITTAKDRPNQRPGQRPEDRAEYRDWHKSDTAKQKARSKARERQK